MCMLIEYEIEINDNLLLSEAIIIEAFNGSNIMHNLTIKAVDSKTNLILDAQTPFLRFSAPYFHKTYRNYKKEDKITGEVNIAKLFNFEKGNEYDITALYNSFDMSKLLGYQYVEKAWYGKINSNKITILIE